MKKNVFISLILCVLVLSFGTAMAAKSQIDNVPGGAAVTYIQAGAGMDALINVQSVNPSTFTKVHFAVWDGESHHIYDWSACLTPYDNYGVVISATDATGGIVINDYSDGFGGNSVPSVGNPGFPATFATYTTSGIAYGYITAVVSADGTSCSAAMGASQYSQATLETEAPDNIFMRMALVSSTAAMAMNTAMLQNFANFGTDGLLETTNTLGIGCFMNMDLDATDTFSSIDDGVGNPNIDWYELLVTESLILPDILHNSGAGVPCNVTNALGASYTSGGPVPAGPRYWARFNDNADYQTVLVTVAPDLSHAPAAGGFDRYDHLVGQAHQMFDDAEVPGSVSTVCPDEVCFTNFGAGLNELHNGSIAAGEVRLNIPFPILGFVITESAAWADIYPLIAEQKAIWDGINLPVIGGFQAITFVP